MLRGEVWWAVWPNDPKQERRPILIVSNNYRNAAPNLLDVVVVKLTGLFRVDGSPKPVNRNEDVLMTFKKETIIRCSSIYSVEKSTLKARALQLPLSVMKDVDERLKNVLDLR